jgi:error-prone DNA polymerase
MAAWRRPGVIDNFRRKLIEGMKFNGLDEVFAERVFNQLRGFGEYGFPESHAASFALLVYASCWIKHHYPEVFCCALLNSQPLGFYAPAQLVQDAQRHQTAVLPADVNCSDWDCTLEEADTERLSATNNSKQRTSLRLGLRMVRGLQESEGTAIATERRNKGLFRDQMDLVKRVKLQQPTLSLLADAGALQSLSGDRRAAYWQSLARDKNDREMPLFAHSQVDHDEEIPESLRRMNPVEEIYADYQSTGLSLQGHPMSFLRSRLMEKRVTTAGDLASTTNGRFVRVAGMILLRQRPGTAKGITFVTMEDETGSINLVLKPEVWKDHYLICKQSNAWFVHGVLENRAGVIHVVAARIEDLQQAIGPITIRSRDFR